MKVNIGFTLFKALILTCFVFSNGCRNGSKSTERAGEASGNHVIIAFNPQPPTEQSASSFGIENVEFVRLDNVHEDALINQIDELVVNDSLIYVIDREKRRSISIFTRSGKYLSKVDKLGKGPNEYASIHDVVIDHLNGDIEVLANNSRKLLKYNHAGEFVKYNILPCPGVFTFAKRHGYYYYYKTFQVCEEELKKGNGARLVRAEAKSPEKIVQTYLPFYFEGRRTPESTIGFSNIVELPGTVDTLVLFEQFTDTVLSITEDGVQPRYLIQFEDEADAKSSILNDPSVLAKSEAIRKEGLSYLLDWLETDQYVMMVYSYFSKSHKQRFVSKALYNKSTEEVSPFDDYSRFVVRLDNIDFDIGRFPMYLTNEGKFVCKLDPSWLLRKLSLEEDGNKVTSPVGDILDRYGLEGITYNDNPILMIFDFNEV